MSVMFLCYLVLIVLINFDKVSAIPGQSQDPSEEDMHSKVMSWLHDSDSHSQEKKFILNLLTSQNYHDWKDDTNADDSCCGTIREFTIHYHEGMLSVSQYDRFIKSEQYRRHSNEFNKNPILYLRKYNLLSAIKDKFNLKPGKIPPKMCRWVFIMYYLFEVAKPGEITHTGLIELKTLVSQPNSVWEGSYIAFSYYVTITFHKACEIIHLCHIPKINPPSTFPLPQEINSVKTPDISIVMKQCGSVFLRIHQKSSFLAVTLHTYPLNIFELTKKYPALNENDEKLIPE